MGWGEPHTPRPHPRGGPADNESAPDRFTREGERLTGAYAASVCRETDRALIEARRECDRLRDAIEAIPRHEPCRTAGWVTIGICEECGADWPCPTEWAHRLIDEATP